MREIALHLLDIAENSVTAGARNISITVCESVPADRLKASVVDDGRGMDPKMLAQVTDPFTTTRTTRQVGLGIPLFKAAAEACSGGLEISSTIGAGTRLEVEFRRSHIDRMPLGDLAGTFLTLVIAYPQVHWVFIYTLETIAGQPETRFEFDDQPVKETLGDVSLCEPEILAFIREMLEQGVSAVQQSAPEPNF